MIIYPILSLKLPQITKRKRGQLNNLFFFLLKGRSPEKKTSCKIRNTVNECTELKKIPFQSKAALNQQSIFREREKNEVTDERKNVFIDGGGWGVSPSSIFQGSVKKLKSTLENIYVHIFALNFLPCNQESRKKTRRKKQIQQMPSVSAGSVTSFALV